MPTCSSSVFTLFTLHRSPFSSFPQRCDACREDRFEMYGSCSTVCPTADMSGLAALPRLTANDYLYLSFLALDISQQVRGHTANPVSHGVQEVLRPAALSLEWPR